MLSVTGNLGPETTVCRPCRHLSDTAWPLSKVPLSHDWSGSVLEHDCHGWPGGTQPTWLSRHAAQPPWRCMAAWCSALLSCLHGKAWPSRPMTCLAPAQYRWHPMAGLANCLYSQMWLMITTTCPCPASQGPAAQQLAASCCPMPARWGQGRQAVLHPSAKNHEPAADARMRREMHHL